MNALRESVRVKTATGELAGHLYVGVDGLSELRLDTQLDNEHFTPAQFPAAWTLRAIGDPGALLAAWWGIQGIREDVARAEREAEEDDNDKERARENATENRIAQEIDERREDETLVG